MDPRWTPKNVKDDGFADIDDTILREWGVRYSSFLRKGVLSGVNG